MPVTKSSHISSVSPYFIHHRPPQPSCLTQVATWRTGGASNHVQEAEHADATAHGRRQQTPPAAAAARSGRHRLPDDDGQSEGRRPCQEEGGRGPEAPGRIRRGRGKDAAGHAGGRTSRGACGSRGARRAAGRHGPEGMAPALWAACGAP
eukprot:scaffold4766_cov390-Prasinococcus_capsulatus_cf.AAC.8